MKKVKIILAFLLTMVCVRSEAALSFKEELSRLEGVVSVDVIEQKSPVFREKYVAWFEQPLDWTSPDIGTFLQRVEIGFSGWENVNVVYVGGYSISDSAFANDDRTEIAKTYNGNYIKIEYRYFGKSVPEGLSEQSIAMWEYLTNAQASADFHNIMEQLRTILSGTWVFSGASKGGQATNIFSYYYPNDADAYVAYVAPFCDGADDPRMGEAVFTVIGNERYGLEKAKEYRDLMMSFQIEVIRNRDYFQKIVAAENDPRGYITDDHKAAIYLELLVNDYVTTVWQYDQEFDDVKAVMDMPHESSEDKKAYLDAIAGILIEQGPVYGSFSYVVQTATENGNYRPCFKYLREALAQEGLSLELREGEENLIWNKMLFTDEQMKVFTFDPHMRNEMIKWSHTTESNVIMIYGNSDPWYFVRLPDVDDNPNVHIFTSEHSHLVSINSMSQEEKEEILSLLDTWLMQDRGTGQGKSSSGNCSVGRNWGVMMMSVAFVIMRKKL